MRKIAFILTLALLVIAGCTEEKGKFTEEEMAIIPYVQKEGLPEASGGFALTVGNETIAADDIITNVLTENFTELAQSSSNFEQFINLAKPEVERIIITEIGNSLIYQEAKRKLGEDLDEILDKFAEIEVRKFVAGFGGNAAKAEQAIKEAGMDWNSFKKYQKRIILSQNYVSTSMPEPSPITYSDMMNYYNLMKEQGIYKTSETVQFRLIDIQPARFTDTQPNKSPQAQAKQLSIKITERLKKGDDFEELAKLYSHGHMATFGGLWKPLQPSSLAAPYDILAKQIENMQTGQLIGPIETDDHIFIMRLEKINAGSVESFENVQKEIEAKIAFDRRKKAVDKFSAEIARKARTNNQDIFVDFCLKKLHKACSQ